MATGVVSWSQTAASNATADATVNWAEGMAPSAVNDSARAEMASVAKYRDDQAGSLTTGGTSTAYTLTTNQVFASLAAMSGQSIRVKFNATCGASPTLNVDTLGAKSIYLASDTTKPLQAGAITANSILELTYDNSLPGFIVNGTPSLATLTNSLSGDVALNNVANFFDGPSVAQGTAGTWLATGYVSLLDTGTSGNFFVKLWDGTTVIADTFVNTAAANSNGEAHLSGVITSPAGNIRISVKDTAAATGKILFNSGGNSKSSTLTVIRIAP